MSGLEGRNVLVTGGGSGVGAAIALALAEAGAEVTIAGRRQEPLETTARRHDRIHATVADVADELSVAALYDEIESRAGPVDIAVANAGAAASQPFERMSLEEWNSMLAANLTGSFLTLRRAAPAMLERGWGRMICIASTAARKGYPYVAGYCAAKHGVLGLTRALAVEYARTGITVNSICPGFTESPMLEASVAQIMHKTGRSEAEARRALVAGNPMGRFIRPQEVAAAVLWLCDPASAAVNGEAIGVSGGEL